MCLRHNRSTQSLKYQFPNCIPVCPSPGRALLLNLVILEYSIDILKHSARACVYMYVCVLSVCANIGTMDVYTHVYVYTRTHAYVNTRMHIYVLEIS